MNINTILLIAAVVLLMICLILAAVILVSIRNAERNTEKTLNTQITATNSILQEQNRNSLEANRAVYSSLTDFRSAVDGKLTEMISSIQQNLTEIRKTVDEKLQESLDNRLNKRMEHVTEQLEKMYRSIGEIQSITTSVADIKKVLSNTKQRGILGEIQLKSILEDIMPRQQYEENVATVPGSTERVEFAVKMPSQSGGFVYMPIDSKFPAETYTHLVDARDEGNKEAVEEAKKLLITRLKSEAQDIRNKYIHVPDTTDFGIMFLPTESLYSEACNLGMMEVLQREYHVTIAGPSSMAALLNSLQTGFRALDVQKRSVEIYETLGAVKTEFGKFEDLLNGIQNRLKITSEDLDKLVGARARAINRKLRNIEENKAITFDGNGDTYEDHVDLLENK